MNIQWFPGHMAKTKRLLSEKLKIVDLAIVVCDARAPKSTLNTDFDELFKDKIVQYVMNKADLADEKTTREWTRHFEEKGLLAIEFSSTKDKPEKLLKKIDESVFDLKERYRNKGMNKTVRAMVTGIPNVGKSALLNRLAGQKKAKEGNKPGITRGLQWVKLNDYLELMDTPGILMPKLSDQETALKIACLGSIKEEILNIDELALFFIELVNEIDNGILTARYGIDIKGNPLDCLEGICKKRGFLIAKGEYDLERGAKVLLDEFQTGKLGRISIEKP